MRSNLLLQIVDLDLGTTSAIIMTVQAKGSNRNSSAVLQVKVIAGDAPVVSINTAADSNGYLSINWYSVH